MFGNDVVWLEDPRNRGRSSDRRLVNRILTNEEALWAASAPEPDRFLWSLWAAKEAVFKSLSRDNPESVFSPRSLAVEVFGLAGSRPQEGRCGGLSVRWSHGETWTHALAGDGLDRVGFAVGPLKLPDGDESAAVRSLADRCLSEAGYPAGAIEGRPPVYRWTEGSIPISLSHDGPWGAVAYPLLG